jgi:CheY-like chemotaxis protein
MDRMENMSSQGNTTGNAPGNISGNGGGEPAGNDSPASAPANPDGSHTSAPANPEANHASASRPSASRCSVLIVDDEPDIALSAREAIERFVPGAHVTVANSYASAVAALEKEPVDVALVDYRMPGKDGLEFVSRAHELEPGLPVILMTGHGSVEVAARAINRHQVQGFLPKPFDAVVLAETVQAALNRSAAA